MTGPKVSMIIPVYKVENYLDRCLQSIAAQTYEDLEVILIDDGSPDKSGAICDEFAAKHDHVIVLHQKNQGQSAARNHGLEVATGQYITYVDSDDIITPDYVEVLMTLCQKYSADIAVGGNKYQYEGKPLEPVKDTDPIEECLTPEEALIRMNYGRGFGIPVWARLYKREIIEGCPFPEGRIYEDLAIACRHIGAAKRIAVTNRKFYYWMQHAGSTMRPTTYDERQFQGLNAAREQQEYIHANYPGAADSADARLVSKIIELLPVTLFNGKQGRARFPELRKEMIQNGKSFLRDEKVKSSLKYRYRAASMGYLPAKITFWLHGKLKEKVL